MGFGMMPPTPPVDFPNSPDPAVYEKTNQLIQSMHPNDSYGRWIDF